MRTGPGKGHGEDVGRITSTYLDGRVYPHVVDPVPHEIPAQIDDTV
jgi:hypothetical protein